MNKAQFAKYLNQPIVPITDVDGLKELSKNFPYFQTTHSLYLKSLRDTEHMLFDSYLKVAAVYSPNRTALYRLLTDKAIVNEVIESKKVAKPDVFEDEIQIQYEKEIVHETEKPIVASELDNLEQEILYSAINASISQEVLQSDVEEIPTFKIKQQKIQEEPIHKEKPKARPIDTSGKKKKSFTEWLMDNKREEVKETSELAEEPHNKNKKDFFSAEKMAKQSIVDDSEIVSETLANIYYAQANYEKALETYEKLSLRFPEKRTYFVAQIEIIKSKIKNTK